MMRCFSIALLCCAAPATALAGGECKTGCAAAKHADEVLSAEEIRAWLEAYQLDPVDQPAVAIDTLLYYAPQIRGHLKEHGPGPLDRAHADFLERELTREHALLEVRLVDDRGRVQANLKPQRIRLGHKEHVTIHPEGALQPFIYSGTVKRVGLRHIWGRL